MEIIIRSCFFHNAKSENSTPHIYPLKITQTVEYRYQTIKTDSLYFYALHYIQIATNTCDIRYRVEYVNILMYLIKHFFKCIS